MTMKDLLRLVDELGTVMDEKRPPEFVRGQFGWHYQEVTQEDLPDGVVCYPEVTR